MDQGIDQFGKIAAHNYSSQLDGIIALIGDNPFMARLRLETAPAVRAHPTGIHVIIYTVDEHDDVLILRVRHGRENRLDDPQG